MKARLILLYMAVYMYFRPVGAYTCVDIRNKFGESVGAKGARNIIMSYLNPLERVTFSSAYYDITGLLCYEHETKFKRWRSLTLLRMAFIGK